MEEPEEAAAAARLVSKYSATQLTVWPGAEAARSRWPQMPQDPGQHELPRFAHAGASSHAVAARQTLNAGAALQAAKGDELGGTPLDWLLHLDADEFFYLQGNGRGGATVGSHFAAGRGANLHLLRYANHELLPPPRAGNRPCFKLNPRVAAARFGRRGWSAIVKDLQMEQSDPRPYFSSYHNGKSAVFVPAGRAAAGVHSWALRPGRAPANKRFLAGPAILHCHCPTREAFRQKYLAKAKSQPPAGRLLFESSPMEEAASDLIRALRQSGAGEQTVERRLDDLYQTLTSFSEPERKILDEAGLILRPTLEESVFPRFDSLLGP